MPRGAKVVSRALADRDRGEANWPKCMICRRAVDAYGISNETEKMVEVWVRCDGIRRDPNTGAAVHGAPYMHGALWDGVQIPKTVDWTHNRFVDAVRRLGFFDVDAEQRPDARALQ